MILGPDGKRLSKRHGAQAVDAFEDEGVLPEAMVNFLALLGWSPGTDEELLSRDEMVERFSLERVLKKGAVFDRDKLWWMNGQYIARMDPGERAATLRDRLARDGIDPDNIALSDASFRRMATALAPRSRTLAEMATLSRPYIGPVRDYDPKAARKAWWRDREGTVATLSAVRDFLAATSWETDALEAALRSLAAAREVGAGKVFQPLRVALTGLSASPGIFDVLLILGRDRSIRRVERAISYIEADR